MARYIKDVQIGADAQTIHAAISQYLVSEGYEYIEYDGENVFKKGNGVWTNPTFFKFSYFGNQVRMETWMKYAFFPGVYIGELGVTGMAGSAVKGPWKKRIARVEGILSNMAAQAPGCAPAPVQNYGSGFDNSHTTFHTANDHFGETCVLSETSAAPVASAGCFCTGCGSRLSEGTLFCSVCGQKCADTTVQNVVQQNNAVYQQPNPQGFYGSQAPAYPTGRSISRKEFINQYAQPSLRKNITSIAILCYVCAGLTFIISCIVNPLGIIDAVILAGLALGMQFGKSRVCAILILVLSIIEVLVSLVSGGFPFWWLIAGVSAVTTFSKIEKQYKQFISGNTNGIG